MKLSNLLSSRLSPDDLDAEVLDPLAGMVEQVTRFHPGLIACADARIGFAPQVNAPLIQAYGLVNRRSLAGAWGSQGADGVYASVVDGSPVRIERVVDPADSAKRCWLFRLHSSDPDTAGAGAKRTEFSYSPPGARLQQFERYVIGLAFRLGDWRDTDDGGLVWQIHQHDGISGSPWLSGYVYGPEFHVAARHNPDPLCAPKSVKYLGKLWAMQYQPQRWYRVVIETVEDYRGGGVANVWIDGAQVVGYRGPLGYNEGETGSYLKTGVYHWTNSGNAWDMRAPLRECWHKGAYIARGITPAAMDAFLATI